jgi:rod shape-determining protein MreD
MNALGILQRLKNLLWVMLPFLLALFCVFVYASPLRVGNFTIPMPLFPFMVIYFWSMTRPEFMPAMAIFLIGLLQDLLTGGPLGLWALTYLVTTAILSTQIDVIAGRGRGGMWAGFVLAVLLASGLAWGFARLALGPGPAGGRLGMEMLLSILAYPLAGRWFSILQRATNQARRLTVTSTMVDY